LILTASALIDQHQPPCLIRIILFDSAASAVIELHQPCLIWIGLDCNYIRLD
jgi:hypothetical protein